MHIALHDGFSGQTVTVAIDGQEAYRRNNVCTDRRMARADAFNVQVGQPVIVVAVAVEPDGLHAAVTINAATTPYVAVDLIAGAIRIRPSSEPFRYR